MRQLIALLVVLGLLGGGAYLYFFKRSDTVRIAKGYKDADTPQVAADMFKKAIEAREYEIAAHYCTDGAAEQYKRGAKAGAELGEAIDNLNYQLKEHGLARDELKYVLWSLDPFPKDIQITVGKESGDTAEATIAFTVPAGKGWSLNNDHCQAFAKAMVFKGSTAVVPLKKVKNEWKFDFPTDAGFQNRVGLLNDKYKNYVNPIKIVTTEIKNDPSTKENVTTRLKTLLEQAAKE